MNLNTVSDKIVFSILRDIKVGLLELTNYDGKKYSFGNAKDNLKANIKIKNKNFTFNLIKSGSVGLAESYMNDYFETKNLSNLIEITARNIKQIHKFSGDVFNAQLVLCADYLVQKQSTVGFIAMKLGTPILSYNLSYTNYEDEMYEIINGSLHIENLEELSRTLPLLFEEGTLREIRARQEVACEKFCLNIDYASDKVAQEIKKLLLQ